MFREYLVNKLKSKGRFLVGLCPFHQEKTPSLNYSEAKDFFHCFGCGEKGTGKELYNQFIKANKTP